MIKVKIVGTPETPEYTAAETLKAILERDTKPQEQGSILIASGVTCFGQEVKDIDLVVFGHLKGGFARKLWSKARKLNSKELEDAEYRYVNVTNFCFCIEVKDHEDVQFQLDRALVRYKDKLHDATHQSERQKYALKSFLEETLDWTPYICNFIWFRNVPRTAFPNVSHNWIDSAPTLDDILTLACIQRFPMYSARFRAYTFSCAKSSDPDESIEEFEDALGSFTHIWSNLGKLTRDRLERITKILLKDQQYAQAIGEKLVSIEGRAGTGKTIKLLHIAHDLCVEQDKRCLILTYNKALVSDIRRLIALAKIDSGIATATIEVKTIHSFMYSLMLGFGLLDASIVKQFLSQYDDLKQQFLAFLREGVITSDDIQKLMIKRHEEVAWDVILVDEGQDWPSDEKDILFSLFKPHNFVVADGIDQLIRSPRRTNWKSGVPNQRTFEKRSLRQKVNLCRFQRQYADLVGVNWDLLPKDDLIGGKVIIVAREYEPNLHQQLIAECEQSGNKPYEMLFAVPPSLVVKESMLGSNVERQFMLTQQWKEWGIPIWDGTSDKLRSAYPKNVDEFRLVQYESCRGLEGWTVVCLWMDDFIEYKKSTFADEQEGQVSLGLQSEAEKRRDFAYKWSMIPLTRAVDTLVITLKDPKSEYAKILRQVAQQCQDFVEWID
jgi:hypothetical protein